MSKCTGDAHYSYLASVQGNGLEQAQGRLETDLPPAYPAYDSMLPHLTNSAPHFPSSEGTFKGLSIS